MTFLINKKSSSTNSFYRNQSGVSLMLSVLVLTAITAISFSLVTIVFIELRASRDVLRSEPALYATLGVTEEALFQYKRDVNERDDGSTVNILDVVNCLPAQADICQLNGVNLMLPGVQPKAFDNTPKIQTVFGGNVVTLPLFQLDSFALQYNQIQLQLIPTRHTGRLQVKLVAFTVDGVESEIAMGSIGEGETLQLNNFQSNTQYQLILDNSANTDENKLVSIRSLDVDGTTPKGLPLIGTRVLEVVANYAGLTKNYTVRIPVP